MAVESSANMYVISIYLLELGRPTLVYFCWESQLFQAHEMAPDYSQTCNRGTGHILFINLLFVCKDFFSVLKEDTWENKLNSKSHLWPFFQGWMRGTT